VSLADKISDRSAVVGVIGLGYVGLPLTVAFARAGFAVVGVDSDERKVDAIRRGRSYIGDVSSADLARLVQEPDNSTAALDGHGGDGRASAVSEPSRRLAATSDYRELAACHAIFICVPTPFDAYKTPDLSYVVSATEAIADIVRPGHLIVLQSTTYPGTTEEVVQPILERGGLRAGHDFHLAFSPERIDPGNRNWNVQNLPKVVGGLSPTDTELAADLLRQINPDVHTVSSPRAAEMTKLLENIFRSVNIALVNELALLAERMDLDIWEVIEAAATKPFGYLPFYPGPGVGGHCIPVDPYYLAWKAREYDFATRFIELAAETNQRMPYHVVELIAHALGQQGVGLRGARVLLLGTAFKAGVDDARNSPSARVIELLLERGAEVDYHDPFIPRFEVKPNAFYAGEERVFESVPLSEDVVAERDCTVILVGHRNVDYELVLRSAPLIVDAANVVPPEHRRSERVVRLGAGTHANGSRTRSAALSVSAG
jgi:UDP-N-acetyl-D-glucosamine dehydrogenase